MKPFPYAGHAAHARVALWLSDRLQGLAIEVDWWRHRLHEFAQCRSSHLGRRCDRWAGHDVPHHDAMREMLWDDVGQHVVRVPNEERAS